jgi:hypothetical protein
VTKDPKREELVDQIASGWVAAQAQLERLRKAVDAGHALGNAKVRLEAVQREREAKLMALGEVALAHFREAKDVPSGLRAALEAVKVAEAKLAAQRSSIQDLLAEADVVREKPVAKKPAKK